MNRIEELEDAITEAGITLAGAEMETTIEATREAIKRAMKILGSVMADEGVLRRQGI